MRGLFGSEQVSAGVHGDTRLMRSAHKQTRAMPAHIQVAPVTCLDEFNTAASSLDPSCDVIGRSIALRLSGVSGDTDRRNAPHACLFVRVLHAGAVLRQTAPGTQAARGVATDMNISHPTPVFLNTTSKR